MIATSSASRELRRTLPATLRAVEEFFAEFRRYARGSLADAHYFAAELLTREALNNAVLHGCHADPGKRIRCLLRIKRRFLTIVVSDDGDGFDWHAVWDRQSVASVPSGRGVQILRTYATRVRYNDTGNTVTIFKRCD